MKFALAPLALAMVMATAAFAQDTSSSSSATVTSASSTSSSASAMATSAAEDSSSSVCALLPGYAEGDPQQPDYGCTYSSTSTPTYDSVSLASYLIGKYRPGKEGYDVTEVASELAESAVGYYPTLTQNFDAIRDQYAAAITASISSLEAEGASHADNAMGVRSNKILAFAGAAAAVVAGGAFML
ncbi:hypothetical protein BCV69DRAFT_277288 [Microstroma glucosiphilum]|uniref:Uncharacterized protein n=1 Tax=Pseudomicrostroma glucosiphilum TaxID=1684307 RepID=A0A316U862_9BASI|nr:hypothetical protein BCV69DRAFT_277288 [Pseudomicrostroma glucosiphilum]PWN20553.1 hypothetical protein BCV69DRAFT_277288 [Pseudomicrostroma glucosiphilum]